MYNLIIDIGNTLAKMALFHNRELIKTFAQEQLSTEKIIEFLDKQTVDNSILSSVRAADDEIENYLNENTKYTRFSTSLTTTVNLLYKSPETLGLDRFAAVIGASALFAESNCLVIDAGTCITYDFVDRDKNYYGGSISPGINMRYKAMHTFTGKLPLLNFDPTLDMKQGNNTQTAMQTGVQNGILHEIKGFITAYKQQYPELIIVLCGGDANYFDTQLKNSIFAPDTKAIPNLVMIGLNQVIVQRND